jgi:hypothetical protein
VNDESASRSETIKILTSQLSTYGKGTLSAIIAHVHRWVRGVRRIQSRVGRRVVPVLELAEQAGLSELIDTHVDLTSTRVASGAANSVGKLTSIIAGTLTGADSIDDVNWLFSSPATWCAPRASRAAALCGNTVRLRRIPGTSRAVTPVATLRTWPTTVAGVSTDSTFAAVDSASVGVDVSGARWPPRVVAAADSCSAVPRNPGHGR